MPDETSRRDAEQLTLYRERAHLVALLAATYPSTWGTDPDWADWHVVYVELPTGQASWHISPNDVDLFPHVSGPTPDVWDGHTTVEKYRRVAAHARHLAAVNSIVHQPSDQPACRRCRTPFDPGDTRFDGTARHADTPWCRRCVDNCHEAGADHRCVICHNYASKA